MERAKLCIWLGNWELGMSVLGLGTVYSRTYF